MKGRASDLERTDESDGCEFPIPSVSDAESCRLDGRRGCRRQVECSAHDVRERSKNNILADLKFDGQGEQGALPNGGGGVYVLSVNWHGTRTPKRKKLPLRLAHGPISGLFARGPRNLAVRW